jgi:hypothetical protein
VLTLEACKPKRSKRLRGFGEEFLLELPVRPRLGHNLGPVAGTDFRLISFDQDIDRGGIDIALLQENTFERAHAKLHIR